MNIFEPEHVTIIENSVTSLWIRPEFIEKLSKTREPCILDERYSYTRVSEKHAQAKVHFKMIYC